MSDRARSSPTAREIIDASAKCLARQLVADLRVEADSLNSLADRMEKDLELGYRPAGALFGGISRGDSLNVLWGKVQTAYDALRTVSNVEILK